MKGISLPIDVIVVVVIAVLVLIVIAFFFTSSTNPGFWAMSHQDAWVRGCGIAKMRGCDNIADFSTGGIIINGYNPDGTGGDDDLLTACKNVFNIEDDDEAFCKSKCCGD